MAFAPHAALQEARSTPRRHTGFASRARLARSRARARLDAIEQTAPGADSEYFKREIDIAVEGRAVTCLVYEINPARARGKQGHVMPGLTRHPPSWIAGQARNDMAVIGHGAVFHSA